MQGRCSAFVPKFMHSLMGDHEVKFAQVIGPIWFQEVALHKLDNGGTFTQPLSRKLMHGCGEVEGNIPSDVWYAIKEVLCEKARAGAKLK